MSLNVCIHASGRYLAHLSACMLGFINWIQTNVEYGTLYPNSKMNWYAPTSAPGLPHLRRDFHICAGTVQVHGTRLGSRRR